MSSSLMSTYARADVAFVRGEGAWLEDQQGRRYLDFGSGVAVNALGHAHPHLIQALTEQAQQLWHTSNLFQMPEGERLARRLCEATFADRVFFTNSGAEALECTIKLVRKYHHSKGQSQKWRIITFEGAFHGRTLATLAAGGQKKYLEGFGPPVTGFDQVPFGDHEALKAAITPETAGILVEPIQGEGGIRPVPPVCLRGLRELCDHHGLLLAFDEVQTGVGRTGTFLAYEASGITPDVVALAKGLGGGFPVGACLATEDAASGMTAGTHGSTFGGNPLAMAVGNAVLDIVLADQFLQDVRDKSLYLRQHLAEVADRHPDIIQEVRGQGFLMGVKVHPLNTDVVTAARAQGLITIAAGDNVVRLLPPLIISKEDIKEGVERLAAACVALKQNSTLTS